MWYECLPTLAIIGVAMCSYQITGYYITKAMYGKPRKDLDHCFSRVMWDRDSRVAGAPWNCPGLENIPDN